MTSSSFPLYPGASMIDAFLSGLGEAFEDRIIPDFLLESSVDPSEDDVVFRDNFGVLPNLNV